MKVKLTEFVKYHDEDFDNALKIVKENYQRNTSLVKERTHG